MKTDNSHIKAKVNLRINHLPEGDIYVLDCYSGKGIIWKEIKDRTGRNIKVLPIDIKKDNIFHLVGNNLDFLSTIDLSKFNVVDLDAYGTPFEQLEILFKKEYHGTVFVTFIQSIMGAIPYRLLESVGFTREMINKIPTLFYRCGWNYFLQYLANKNIDKIYHYSFDRKHYLYFTM